MSEKTDTYPIEDIIKLAESGLSQDEIGAIIGRSGSTVSRRLRAIGIKRDARGRMDGLPESRNWPDKGCDLAPKCLECPFPQCRYDLPGGALQAARPEERYVVIREMHAAGMHAADIAEECGIGLKTVYRALKGLEGPALERVLAKGLEIIAKEDGNE